VRLAPSKFIVEGTAPRGATGMRMRFEDGTTEEPDIFANATFVTWLGPGRLAPGHRPIELVAIDADGHELNTFRLEPEQFTSR
jgi:hypothetical protein